MSSEKNIVTVEEETIIQKHYLDDIDGIMERRNLERENFRKSKLQAFGGMTRLMKLGQEMSARKARAKADERRVEQIRMTNKAIKVIKKYLPDLKVRIGTCRHCGAKFRYIENFSSSLYRMNREMREAILKETNQSDRLPKISDRYCSEVCKFREAQKIKNAAHRKLKKNGGLDTKGYVITTYYKTNDHRNRVVDRKFVRNLVVDHNGLKYDEDENVKYDYATKNFEAKVLSDNYDPISWE